MASVYDKAARMVIESYYGQVAEEIVSRLKSGVILDLGTGPGYLPIEIVKRSPSIKVDCIDSSRSLIRIARRNALKAGVADKLHFEVGNAAKLQLVDNSYDMVISSGMLHMLKNPIKVLMECYRVLKTGGEAWIYDPARVSSQIDVEKWQASLTFTERFLNRIFTLFSRLNPPRTYSQEQLIEIIAATQFKEYQIEGGGNELKIKLKK